MSDPRGFLLSLALALPPVSTVVLVTLYVARVLGHDPWHDE